MLRKLVMLAVLLGAAAPAARQMRSADDWCRNEGWGRDRAGVCEVREFTLPASGGVLNVDASPNGGISVEGSARNDVLIYAKVVAAADTENRAREIASGVHVTAAADNVQASGPTGLRDRESWHVSYHVFAPTQTSVDLRTVNGGIRITDVEGRLQFQTVNGGVRLKGLGGDVQGRTRNGGVDIDLDGDVWRGDGLDVETENGGVRLAIPAQYSARLETGTVNGRVRLDFPLTIQGRLDRDLQTTLGAGGPLLRVRTTNGGVTISRK